MKTVFITGATSGIGEACARLLSPEYRLILCGRRVERLNLLKDELSNVITLNFDVRNREDVNRAISDLPNEWSDIDILINNAGNAHGMASFHEGDVDDWDAMIDINVKGLLYVSKAIIPAMVKKKSGHIINIGSIAGKEVYPKGAVYSASKHAVDAINNGMRLDLVEFGIKVSQVNPGMVETEFSQVRFKGDTEKAKSMYKGYEALTAKDIAELLEFIISRPAHVNLSDTIIFPSAQAAVTYIKKR